MLIFLFNSFISLFFAIFSSYNFETFDYRFSTWHSKSARTLSISSLILFNSSLRLYSIVLILSLRRWLSSSSLLARLQSYSINRSMSLKGVLLEPIGSLSVVGYDCLLCMKWLIFSFGTDLGIWKLCFFMVSPNYGFGMNANH